MNNQFPFEQESFTAGSQSRIPVCGPDGREIAAKTFDETVREFSAPVDNPATVSNFPGAAVPGIGGHGVLAGYEGAAHEVVPAARNVAPVQGALGAQISSSPGLGLSAYQRDDRENNEGGR